MRAPLAGRRRFRGRLLGYADRCARLLVDGAEVSIPFADVAKANVLYEFTRNDFEKGKGGPGR
jgi:ribosome maturation factor RimP